MKANELKKGNVIAIDNANIIIKEVHVQAPSSRSGSTLYKVQGRNIISKQKWEKTFKGDEILQEIEFSRRPVQLLYKEEQSSTFMDNETYDQYSITNDLIETELPYLADGLQDITALITDNNLLGIELPGTVIMQIVECAPGIKGASASARTKPATMPSGLVVQVPEYLSPGENIKINTGNGEFVSRA